MDLVQLVLALLGVVHRWRVAVVEEMAGCYEAVTACTVLLVELYFCSGYCDLISPLFPGPQATRIRFPLLSGCNLKTSTRQKTRKT